MALLQQLPDAAVLASYQAGLTAFGGEHLWPPYQLIYVAAEAVSAKQLAEGAGPDQLQYTGSRFLARLPDGTAVTCEMTAPRENGPVEFRNIVHGETPEIALRRIGEAQAISRTRGIDYELRLVSVPDVFVEALRLRALDGSGDLYLPVVGPPLVTESVLGAAEFFSGVRAVAGERTRLRAVVQEELARLRS